VRAELHLARRYLGRLRRRTHVATVSGISLVSLALGVLALVITLSLLEGFQSTIRRELLQRSAHARLAPASGRVLPDAKALVSVLRAKLPNVAVTEIVSGTCLARSFADAIPALVEGRSNTHRVAIDHILAARLGVGPGEQVEVISSRRRLTPLGPVPVRVRLEIADVVAPEPGRESGALTVPLDVAQRLLWGKPVVQSIELRDPADPWHLARQVRQALAGRFPGLRVDGLQQLHRSLLLALSMERIMIFVAVGLMLVVASLNLLCNVAMIAAEKRTDLAVLSGLGLTPSGLRRLFVLLGLAIGTIATVVGAGMGTLVAVTLDRTHALTLPRGVFIVSSVPFRVRPEMVATVSLVALGLAILASWLPARSVARRDPAEGLRYE
jgi:lipoprotein-releasing system permease protein